MIQTYTHTELGSRKNNEDYFSVKEYNECCVACIADGVGGSLNGDFASKFVVDRFTSLVDPVQRDNISQLLSDIHYELIEKAKELNQPNSMATTFTGCLIFPEKLYGIHVGDSRLCILRGNGIKELTEEHSEVARFIREGLIKFENKHKYIRKHILEHVVGVEGLMKIQEFSFELNPLDRIILSTDGFHNVFSKLELRDFSKKYEKPEDFGNYLKKEMLDRQLSDNATFVLVQI